MYSRHTSSGGYTADYLRARYAEKTSPRRSPFREPTPPEAPVPEKPVPLPVSAPVTQAKPKEPSGSGISSFISNLEGDDLLILAVLALILLGDGEKKDLDLILAAALIFIEFS